MTHACDFIHVETSHLFAHSTDIIRSLGFRPVLLTRIRRHDPRYYEGDQLAAYDAVYDADTLDSGRMVVQVRDLGLEPAAVLSCYDDMVIPAAELARMLGLPHPDLNGLHAVHAKEDMRRNLAAAGFPQPNYLSVEPERLPRTPPMDYPFVVKPSRDAGTDGVHICRNGDDYAEAVAKIFAGDNRTFSGAYRGRVVLEAYIDGPQYALEMLWTGGGWVSLGAYREFVDSPDSLCVASYVFPSDLPAAALGKVEAEILEWVIALGLRGGALCVEFKLPADRPVLIEINPRHGGARAYDVMALSFGKPPIAHLYRQAAGLPDLPLDCTPNDGFHYAEAFLFPPRTGLVVAVEEPASPCDHRIDFSTSELPRSVSHDCILDNVIGSAIARGRSCEHAMANADAIISQATVRYAD